MSINKIVASVLVSLVLIAGIAQVASAADINANNDDCKAAGGTPNGKTLCTLK